MHGRCPQPQLEIAIMPKILSSASELLGRYDVLFCDVWGVLHNGIAEYEAAGDALERFRAGGGAVVLVSNAPMPATAVAKVLAHKNVRANCWDAIVTSGDVARSHLEDKAYARIHVIGQDRDLPLYDGLRAAHVGIDEAEAIVCTGLSDDRTETGEDYRERLQAAARRKLPFVCANPDIVVDVGGTMLPCAGQVAKVYQSLGGPVYWAGKPHRAIYKSAFAAAKRVRGPDLTRNRVLAIGDAYATDLHGAREFGVDALFIAGGIHRVELMLDGALDTDTLRLQLRQADLRPVAASPALAW
jgi:HAD superfamily hydrolase (TIGR01459 family)